MIKSENDSIGHWSAEEKSQDLPPAASSQCNVISDFWAISLRILRGERERDWNSAGKAKGKGKTVRIKAQAVMALATPRTWFMGEKKWPCLSAVSSGPCDLLWWLEPSHRMCSGCWDGTGEAGDPVNTDYKSMLPFSVVLLFFCFFFLTVYQFSDRS